MTRAEEVTQNVKEYFESYSLDYYKFFGYFDEDDGWIELQLGKDDHVDMKALAYAAMVLGVSTEDLLNDDIHACFKWVRKYSYFDHFTFLNHEFERSSYDDTYDAIHLIETIYDVELYKPPRYNLADVKCRLLDQLKEMNKSIPGIYHEGEKIKSLHIETAGFCHYEKIDEMVESYLEMLNRGKELFFKAWDSDLEEEEIQEYNMIVSAIGFQDFSLRVRGYLYYDNLKRCVDVYRSEGYSDFFDYVRLDSKKSFLPWRAAEFVENRELAQKYVNNVPGAKAEMRKYANKVTDFDCSFEWTDTYRENDKYLQDMLTSMGDENGNDELINGPVEIYVPKTQEELGEDGIYAEKLLALCGPRKKGGLSVPSWPEFGQEELVRSIRRMSLIKPVQYLDRLEGEMNGRYVGWGEDDE